ncbi:MAG: hypothetical protein NC218_05525 [Acetobacter sp.]|nr:hypothetical protein [Acetobacter sp.]
MAGGKERSSLFKFLYTVLKIITFPIYAVLYVLKHPVLALSVLFLLFCLVIAYPMRGGVSLEEVPEWYKKKFTEVKYNVVAEAGNRGLVSQDVVENLAEEVADDQGLKSENYNAKVSRDKEIEEKTKSLKKRGGFKRKGGEIEKAVEETAEEVMEPQNVESSGLENISAGGLEMLLQEQKSVEENVVEESSQSQPLLPQKIFQPKENATPAVMEQDNLDEFELF